MKQQPVRLHTDIELIPLTQGPRQHFFGYYDKFAVNSSGRRLLAHEVAFEPRPPTGADTVVLGVIDLEHGGQFEPFAETHAWSWQQGAMLQWHPGEPEHTVIYNDRREGQFVAVIHDLGKGRERVLPRPVAAVSHDGRRAMSINFARLADQRPGYGYAGLADPFAADPSPERDGIYAMNLDTGEYRLIVSVGQMAHRQRRPDMEGVYHWFNHLLFSPDDRRFIFLHRWRHGQGSFLTRLYTADADGSNLHMVFEPQNSHFDWRDKDHLLVYVERTGGAWGPVLFTDRSNHAEPVGDPVLTPLGDGHGSYSPDRRWLLTDTYPNAENYRKLLLYDLAANHRIDLADLYSVPWVTECRCDLHPRWSRDGRWIDLDSSHSGARQIHRIDVSKIIGV